MQIEFYGATNGVTGSCHILRANGQLILLDCGLIQGPREAELKNREPFPFSPGDISAVVLSHGHIDHSGRIPLLVKQGYQGPVYAHNATCDLCRILLQDSASLQERDAQYENKWRQRKGKPLVEPLYTVSDVDRALENVVGMCYRERRGILPGVSICFQDAGHILGSSSVEVWLNEDGNEQKIVYSGDLGQYDMPILNDPAAIQQADHVLVESTYGNRRHRDLQKTIDEIGEIISTAAHHRGNILIPAFAVGRSQEVLYMLGKYYRQWDLDRWHVFLDSPMAIDATRIYWCYAHLYDDEAAQLREDIDEMPRLANLHLTASVEESRVINRLDNGAIISAGSGMCTGGRILHHLTHNVWRRECHVIIVGYQARGTLGRQLVDGAPRVRIHGETLRVAARIHTVGGLSAHGDENDLMRWYDGFAAAPRVYLVHGEPEASHALAQALRRRPDADVSVALPGYRLDLVRLGAA